MIWEQGRVGRGNGGVLPKGSIYKLQPVQKGSYLHYRASILNIPQNKKHFQKLYSRVKLLSLKEKISVEY